MVFNYTQNHAFTTVFRTRMLPTWGKVLVRAGQEVKADDVIAIANTSPQHFMVNVARGLGLTVGECKKCIKRQVGDSIKKGSIIAERGNSSRVVRAPDDGTILSIEKGIVLLQSNKNTYELKAGFPGFVDRVLAEQGVTIESTGAYVQGIWGNGKQGSGSLTSFTSSPHEALTRKNMRSKGGNIISFAAYCDNPNVFDHAADKGWKGMIFGSLPSKFIPQISDLPFPVLITEGFGTGPINSYTYELLNSHLGRETSINAITRMPDSKERPELLIPAASDALRPDQYDIGSDLEIGTRVKIIRGKYLGTACEIAEKYVGEMTIFPNGTRSKSVVVNLPNSERKVFPLANIDVFM